MPIKLRSYKIPQAQVNRYIQTMSDTLVLLHVIFRHGDRTPDKQAIYPKDPHKDYDYGFGYGQLTNIGKRRAYRFGQSLRRRYGHLLDNFYISDHLDAWSSDFDRTQMTMQLVLSSLYPPRNSEVWYDDIQWQPIPYHCTPREDDKKFLACHLDKMAVREYENYVNGPGQDIMKYYKDSMDYIEYHTGKRIKGPKPLFNLSCTLIIQERMGLKLPEWTKEIFPDRLEEMAMHDIDFITATPRMKSLAVGQLMQKIVEDSLRKIKGESQHKIHLYSGHDYTVAMFLRVLDLFDYQHPDFCSNVAIELHKIDGVYGFMIKYQRSECQDVKLLEVPNVGSFWPIEDFMDYNKFILEDRPYELNK